MELLERMLLVSSKNGMGFRNLIFAKGWALFFWFFGLECCINFHFILRQLLCGYGMKWVVIWERWLWDNFRSDTVRVWKWPATAKNKPLLASFGLATYNELAGSS